MQTYKKNFDFKFPLNHKVVRNLKIVNEHVGNLTVQGSASKNANESRLSSERFTIDIDFVKWNGTDIKPVLEMTALMDDIHDATEKYVAALFSQPMTHGEMMVVFTNNLTA